MSDSAFLRELQGHFWEPHYPWGETAAAKTEPALPDIPAPKMPDPGGRAPSPGSPGLKKPPTGAKPPKTEAPEPVDDLTPSLDTEDLLRRITMETMEESKAARRLAEEFGGSASDVEQYMLEDAGDLRSEFAKPIVQDAALTKLQTEGIDPRKVRTFDQVRRDVIEDKVKQTFYDREYAKLDAADPEAQKTAKTAARAAYNAMVRERADALSRDVKAQKTAAQSAGRQYQGIELSAEPTDYQLRQAFAQVLSTQLQSREGPGRSISFKEVGRKAARERPEDIPSDAPKADPGDYRGKPAVDRIIRETVVPDTAQLGDPIDVRESADALVAAQLSDPIDVQASADALISDDEFQKLKQINRVFGDKFEDPQQMLYMLLHVARERGADPLNLAKIINFETAGSWKPDQDTKNSTAVGLIQFTGGAEGGRRVVGLSREQLASMSQVEQMVQVGRYLKATAGDRKLDTPQKLYMSVLYPKLMETGLDDRMDPADAAKNPGAETPGKYLAKIESYYAKAEKAAGIAPPEAEVPELEGVDEPPLKQVAPRSDTQTVAGVLAGRDYTEMERIARERGINLVQAPSRTALQLQNTIFEDPHPWLAQPGEKGQVAAAEFIAALPKDQFNLVKLASNMSASTGYDFLRRDIGKRLREATKGLSQAEAAKRFTEAEVTRMTLDLVTKAQTAGLWLTPVTLTLEELTRDEGEEASFWSSGLLPFINDRSVLAPAIEVLGTNRRGEIVYRQESTLMTAFKMFDAVPIIGQSFNIGFIETLIEEDWDSSILRKAWMGGVHGVERQRNLLEVAMENSDYASMFVVPMLMNRAAEAVGLVDEGWIEDAAAEGMFDFAFDPGDTPQEKRVRAQDMMKTAKTLGSVPIGLLAACLHPDLIGGIASGAKAIRGVSKYVTRGDSVFAGLAGEGMRIAPTGETSALSRAQAPLLREIAEGRLSGQIESELLVDGVVSIGGTGGLPPGVSRADVERAAASPHARLKENSEKEAVLRREARAAAEAVDRVDAKVHGDFIAIQSPTIAKIVNDAGSDKFASEIGDLITALKVAATESGTESKFLKLLDEPVYKDIAGESSLFGSEGRWVLHPSIQRESVRIAKLAAPGGKVAPTHSPMYDTHLHVELLDALKADIETGPLGEALTDSTNALLKQHIDRADGVLGSLAKTTDDMLKFTGRTTVDTPRKKRSRVLPKDKAAVQAQLDNLRNAAADWQAGPSVASAEALLAALRKKTAQKFFTDLSQEERTQTRLSLIKELEQYLEGQRVLGMQSGAMDLVVRAEATTAYKNLTRSAAARRLADDLAPEMQSTRLDRFLRASIPATKSFVRNLFPFGYREGAAMDTLAEQQAALSTGRDLRSSVEGLTKAVVRALKDEIAVTTDDAELTRLKEILAKWDQKNDDGVFTHDEALDLVRQARESNAPTISLPVLIDLDEALRPGTETKVYKSTKRALSSMVKFFQSREDKEKMTPVARQAFLETIQRLAESAAGVTPDMSPTQKKALVEDWWQRSFAGTVPGVLSKDRHDEVIAELKKVQAAEYDTLVKLAGLEDGLSREVLRFEIATEDLGDMAIVEPQAAVDYWLDVTKPQYQERLKKLDGLYAIAARIAAARSAQKLTQAELVGLVGRKTAQDLTGDASLLDEPGGLAVLYAAGTDDKFIERHRLLAARVKARKAAAESLGDATVPVVEDLLRERLIVQDNVLSRIEELAPTPNVGDTKNAFTQSKKGLVGHELRVSVRRVDLKYDDPQLQSAIDASLKASLSALKKVIVDALGELPQRGGQKEAAGKKGAFTSVEVPATAISDKARVIVLGEQYDNAVLAVLSSVRDALLDLSSRVAFEGGDVGGLPGVPSIKGMEDFLATQPEDVRTALTPMVKKAKRFLAYTNDYREAYHVAVLTPPKRGGISAQFAQGFTAPIERAWPVGIDVKALKAVLQTVIAKLSVVEEHGLPLNARALQPQFDAVLEQARSDLLKTQINKLFDDKVVLLSEVEHASDAAQGEAAEARLGELKRSIDRLSRTHASGGDPDGFTELRRLFGKLSGGLEEIATAHNAQLNLVVLPTPPFAFRAAGDVVPAEELTKLRAAVLSDDKVDVTKVAREVLGERYAAISPTDEQFRALAAIIVHSDGGKHLQGTPDDIRKNVKSVVKTYQLRDALDDGFTELVLTMYNRLPDSDVAGRRNLSELETRWKDSRLANSFALRVSRGESFSLDELRKLKPVDGRKGTGRPLSVVSFGDKPAITKSSTISDVEASFAEAVRTSAALRSDIGDALSALIRRPPVESVVGSKLISEKYSSATVELAYYAALGHLRTVAINTGSLPVQSALVSIVRSALDAAKAAGSPVEPKIATSLVKALLHGSTGLFRSEGRGKPIFVRPEIVLQSTETRAATVAVESEDALAARRAVAAARPAVGVTRRKFKLRKAAPKLDIAGLEAAPRAAPQSNIAALKAALPKAEVPKLEPTAAPKEPVKPALKVDLPEVEQKIEAALAKAGFEDRLRKSLWQLGHFLHWPDPRGVHNLDSGVAQKFKDIGLSAADQSYADESAKPVIDELVELYTMGARVALRKAGITAEDDAIRNVAKRYSDREVKKDTDLEAVMERGFDDDVPAPADIAPAPKPTPAAPALADGAVGTDPALDRVKAALEGLRADEVGWGTNPELVKLIQARVSEASGKAPSAAGVRRYLKTLESDGVLGRTSRKIFAWPSVKKDDAVTKAPPSEAAEPVVTPAPETAKFGPDFLKAKVNQEAALDDEASRRLLIAVGETPEDVRAAYVELADAKTWEEFGDKYRALAKKFDLPDRWEEIQGELSIPRASSTDIAAKLSRGGVQEEGVAARRQLKTLVESERKAQGIQYDEKLTAQLREGYLRLAAADTLDDFGEIYREMASRGDFLEDSVKQMWDPLVSLAKDTKTPPAELSLWFSRQGTSEGGLARERLATLIEETRKAPTQPKAVTKAPTPDVGATKAPEAETKAPVVESAPKVPDDGKPPPEDPEVPEKAKPEPVTPPEAAIEIFDDGRAAIYLFTAKGKEGAKVALHELVHLFRRYLSPKDNKLAVARYMASNPKTTVSYDVDSKRISGDPADIEAWEEWFVDSFALLAKKTGEGGVLTDKQIDLGDEGIGRILRSIQTSIGEIYRHTRTDDSIDPEMRKMMRRMLGGTDSVDTAALSRVQIELDDRRALSMIEDTARKRVALGLGAQGTAARSPVETVVETTLVDRLRQRATSLDKPGASTPERALLAASGAGGKEAELTAWSVTLGRKLAGAAVAVFGGDPDVLLRETNVAVREMLKRPLRRLATYEADLAQMVVRVTHASRKSRLKANHERLYEFLSGNPVRDHLGRFVMSSGHNAVKAALRGVSDYIFSIHATEGHGRRQILGEAENVLAAASDGSKPTSDTPALLAFWAGYAVEGGEGVVRAEKFVPVSGAAAAGNPSRVLQMITPVAGLEGDTSRAAGVAAVFAFHSELPMTVMVRGKRRSKDEILAMAKNSGDSDAKILMEGLLDEKDRILIPGLSHYLQSPTEQAQVMYALGFEGAAARSFESSVEAGLGLSRDDALIYTKYVTGIHLSPSDTIRAERLSSVFGENARFVLSPDSVEEMYLPRVAVAQMHEVRTRALRQVSQDSEMVFNDYLNTLSSWVNMTVVFGNVIARQPFQFMSLKDLFMSTLLETESPRIAALATTRAAGMVLASALRVPGTGGAIDVFRAATVIDAMSDKAGVAAANALLSRTQNDAIEMTTTRAVVERAARAGGELMADALDKLLGGAVAERYEINAILEGVQGGIMQNERYYSYADLREVFLEAGVLSTPYREMRSALRKDLEGQTRSAKIAWLRKRVKDPNITPRQIKTIKDMIEAQESALSKMKGWRDDALRDVLSHGLEVADAYSIAERVGLTVTLMENGFSPRDAARTAVQVLYDYQGSMTAKDNHWAMRALVPFWSFRKNANMQFANALASPRGAFVIGAFRRANQFGPQALTEVMYEAVVSPYGINTSGLNEDQQDFYYSVRNVVENGFNGQSDSEAIEHMRSILSEEDFAALTSGEGLQGWTPEHGFNGYRNVPEDVRLALRGLFASNFEAFKDDGKLVELSAARERQDIVDAFVQSGVGASAMRAPDRRRIPEWMQSRPVIEIPWLSLDASTEEFIGQTGADVSDSILLMLPDDFVMSAVEFMSSQAGVMLALADQAKRAYYGQEVEPGMVYAAAEGVVNLDRMSPTSEILKTIADPESAPPTKLHPKIAELFYAAGIPLKQIGRKPGTVEHYSSWAAAAVLSLGTAQMAATDFSSKSVPTPLEVYTDDESARAVRQQPLSELMVDAENMRAQQVAYLRGGIASALFVLTPLGQINKMLLQYSETVLEKHGDVGEAETGALINDILGVGLDVYRGVGGRTYQYSDSRIAQQETPR